MTALSNHPGTNAPRTGPSSSMNSEWSKRQLRHDRLATVVVLIVIVALMAIMLWLASLGGTTLEPTDYWPIML